jgi:glycosyltransferase involved in cell wall biosynthesis
MKIAFDAREAFGVRTGKGQLAYHLLCELMKQDHTNEYFVFVSEKSGVDMPANFQEVVVSGSGIMWHLNVIKVFKKLALDLYFSPTSYIVPALASFKTIIIVADMVAFLKITKHQAKATLVERVTLRRAARKTARIITISESSKNDIVKFFPQTAGKIHVVYPAQARHGFVYPSDEGEKEFSGLHLEPGYVLFVGTIEPRKNIDGMLKAYRLYKESTSSYKKLVIVGKKGWHYKETFELVTSLGLENDVVFTGFVSDAALPYLYKNAGCFFFPSWYEGFGLILLEAFKFGCPVVASKTSSMPEVVGDAAVMVSPEDTKGMSEAITRVLTEADLRAKLVAKGYEQEKKFSWENNAKETLLVIEKVQ